MTRDLLKARVASVIIVVLIASMCITVACSSGGDSKKETATAIDPTAAANATVSAGLPPLPTLADPATIALVAQHGTTAVPYDISLPAEWARTSASDVLDNYDVPNPVGKTVDGGPLRAGYLGVLCDPVPADATNYSSVSQAAAVELETRQNGGTFAGTAGTVQLATVGSLDAATLHTTLNFGPLDGRIYHYFIATPQCAWEVSLSIYAPGDEQPYFDLFDRIIQTFHPAGS